jgi:ABC-2 type transport system permease protein
VLVPNQPQNRIPRTAIVLGKSFTGGIRGLLLAATIFIVAVIMGVSISFNPLHLAAVAGKSIVFIFGIGFSSLSIGVSTLVKSQENIMPSAIIYYAAILCE